MGDKIFLTKKATADFFLKRLQMILTVHLQKGCKNSDNIFVLDSGITGVTANAVMICFKRQCLSYRKLVLSQFFFPAGHIVVNEIKHTNRICPQGMKSWTRHQFTFLLK